MTETAEPDETEGAPSTSALDVAEAVRATADTAAAAGVDAHTNIEDDEDVRTVLGEVRGRGFITTGEIFAAFPDREPDTDELRDLYEMFEARGVKVLDEIAEELELEDRRRA